ncbi:GAF domain-containing protein [filamentous cyanobacterium LEGE 11480]|uniref:histidine kinase n=1 Tax=Romeriopsis navalis LEGE 11480 TaxID=2777977 RepID=A0A928VKY1_9CYAN|nr:ATP-binding protein [Romeriopsis navalis]MBE9028511.1 GAF domain-containing protein [Romeriopsis navalis LEGE 11480]
MTSLVYFCLGQFTFQVLDLPGAAPFAIFPPVGVGLALVMLFGWTAVIGVALGAMMLAVLLKAPALIVIGAGLRSGMMAWFVGYLLQWLQVDFGLRRLRDVWQLILLIFPGAIALNASLACLLDIGAYTAWENLPKTWRTLFIADLSSVLMITPFLVLVIPPLCSLNHRRKVNALWQSWWRQRSQALEGLIWLAFTISIELRHVDSAPDVMLLEALPFLSLAWAAARFGIITTVCASFWINSIEIAHVLQGYGIFVLQSNQDTNVALLMLQTFIVVIVFMGLSLAATTEERHELLNSLLQEQQFDRVMVNLAQRVRNSLDLSDIMQTTVQEIYAALKVDRAYLLQRMLDGSYTVTTESHGLKWPSCMGNTIPTATAQQFEVLYRDKGTEITDDLRQAAGIHPLTRQLCAEYQVQSRVAVPVLVDGDAYALLTVHQCSAPRHWSHQEINFLEQVVLLLGASLHQGILYQRERHLVSELDQQVQARTQELQRSLVAQEKLNEGQARLLHAVSHDLRTPIVGSLLVLRQMLKRDEGKNKTVLQRLQESGERQLTLIQSLLEDYRAEDATLRFHFKLIDYAEFVQATLRTLSPILKEYEATVKVDIPAQLPEVQADPVHLQRVLENLITNALKHNQPGLTLQLNACVVNEATIDYLRCEVVDDGVGIPPDVAQQLFSRPYLRSSDGSSRTGIGLGLYLCYQIVIAHGGRLVVEPFKFGVKFVFTIPIAVLPIAPTMLPSNNLALDYTDRPSN